MVRFHIVITINSSDHHFSLPKTDVAVAVLAAPTCMVSTLLISHLLVPASHIQFVIAKFIQQVSGEKIHTSIHVLTLHLLFLNFLCEEAMTILVHTFHFFWLIIQYSMYVAMSRIHGQYMYVLLASHLFNLFYTSG